MTNFMLAYKAFILFYLHQEAKKIHFLSNDHTFKKTTNRLSLKLFKSFMAHMTLSISGD